MGFYSIVAFFQKGGLFMYPILLVFAVGAAIAFERWVQLNRIRSSNRTMWDQLQPVLVKGEFDKARQMVNKDESSLAQMLGMGLARQGAVRRREDIDKVLANSDIVIGVENNTDARLIGFCRILTDYIYKAVVYDVIVHPEFRSRQLGKLLMDSVIHHPDLSEVGHFDLNCLPHMVKFYRRWGFTDELGELKFMRRNNPSR